MTTWRKLPDGRWTKLERLHARDCAPCSCLGGELLLFAPRWCVTAGDQTPVPCETEAQADRVAISLSRATGCAAAVWQDCELEHHVYVFTSPRLTGPFRRKP